MSTNYCEYHGEPKEAEFTCSNCSKFICNSCAKEVTTFSSEKMSSSNLKGTSSMLCIPCNYDRVNTMMKIYQPLASSSIFMGVVLIILDIVNILQNMLIYGLISIGFGAFILYQAQVKEENEEEYERFRSSIANS